jgi:hypothetical protein
MFDTKLKNFVTCYLTWLDWQSGSVRLNEHEHNLVPPWGVRQVPLQEVWQILVDPVDDEDVEEIVHELILQLWQVI